MPADTKARYYQWFTTEDPTQRLLGLEWWPEGTFASSMTAGNLTSKHRNHPDDIWSPPAIVALGIPWVVAQSIARQVGCRVEVAVP